MISGQWSGTEVQPAIVDDDANSKQLACYRRGKGSAGYCATADGARSLSAGEGPHGVPFGVPVLCWLNGYF